MVSGPTPVCTPNGSYRTETCDGQKQNFRELQTRLRCVDTVALRSIITCGMTTADDVEFCRRVYRPH